MKKLRKRGSHGSVVSCIIYRNTIESSVNIVVDQNIEDITREADSRMTDANLLKVKKVFM